MFDKDEEKVGRTSRSGVTVLGADRLAEEVKKNGVDMGIIAVNAENAQTAHDMLVEAGVCAILNFAPIQIRMRRGVKVKSVDLRINLESLAYYLKTRDEE